jgi:hypothetical protein
MRQKEPLLWFLNVSQYAWIIDLVQAPFLATLCRCFAELRLYKQFKKLLPVNECKNPIGELSLVPCPTFCPSYKYWGMNRMGLALQAVSSVKVASELALRACLCA